MDLATLQAIGTQAAAGHAFQLAGGQPDAASIAEGVGDVDAAVQVGASAGGHRDTATGCDDPALLQDVVSGDGDVLTTNAASVVDGIGLEVDVSADGAGLACLS